jgi:hypothetical protein
MSEFRCSPWQFDIHAVNLDRMTTTPDHPATTWRDLADQLSPGQVDKLTEMELKAPPVVMLLDFARDMAEGNVAEAVHFGHLPVPADAVKVVRPHQDDDTGLWTRGFVGREWTAAGTTVWIDGEQRSDGHVSRWLIVSVRDLEESGGDDLTGGQARELAAALIEAADELDRLGG